MDFGQLESYSPLVLHHIGFVSRRRTISPRADSPGMIRIPVSKDTKERLRRRKRPGETYDDVLRRLIEEYEALGRKEESDGRDP